MIIVLCKCLAYHYASQAFNQNFKAYPPKFVPTFTKILFLSMPSLRISLENFLGILYNFITIFFTIFFQMQRAKMNAH